MFLRWTFARSVCHRGYVLVSGLYFVLVAHLSADQLLVLATVVSATLLLSDLPTGVWSDAVSRKWPLVTGHLLLAAGMIMAGLVTGFWLLVAAQVFWGVGWGFSSGADVAWLTDELGEPARTARVLTGRARLDALGSAAGMIAFGVTGWAAGLAVAMVASGAAMAVVGAGVAVLFTEDNFARVPLRQLRDASLSIVRRGVALARADSEIRLVLVATLLLNGASMVSSLFPRQLVNLGLGHDPVLWYAGLGIASFAIGALALRFVEARIDGAEVARRSYAVGCLAGVVGLLLLAYAPDAAVGGLGMLLTSGIAFTVTRAVSVVWVNRRTTSDVRATVHSFLSQAECAGEVMTGFALAGLAHAAGISAALAVSGGLMACVAVLVLAGRARSRTARVAGDITNCL